MKKDVVEICERFKKKKVLIDALKKEAMNCGYSENESIMLIKEFYSDFPHISHFSL